MAGMTQRAPDRDFPEKIISIIAWTEILIGGITVAGSVFGYILFEYLKPLSVHVFVMTTSALSLFIGIGLLFKSPLARVLLLYFSGYIILTKLLIAADIMQLSAALDTWIPSSLKNALSVMYHGAVVFVLLFPQVKKRFTQ